MAEEAEAMNMIYKAVEDEQLEATVQEFATRLAQMPTRGLGLTKRAVNASFNNSLSEQLSVEETLQTEAGQTYDFKEGVAAFMEKRKPVFRGN